MKYENGTWTTNAVPGGWMTTWIGDDYERQAKIMTDQLTRDELLKQRLWAASQDCDAVGELLIALTKDSPPAGTSQEERMRSIEGSLDSMRWNCDQLRRFKGDK